MAFDATWVMLGNGEALVRAILAASCSGAIPERVAVHIGFDERLAHLIEGGCDMFLMPSRFEPCGLNQMYSLRYGTIPIVRATGGLQDTVKDDNGGRPAGDRFQVRGLHAGGAGLGRRARPGAFRQAEAAGRRLQQTAMPQDFSWDVSGPGVCQSV